MTAALRFDGVSMVFPDGTHALHDITLEVEPTEFVTIVGPSGCGKSTLLRIAAGLEQNTDRLVDRRPRPTRLRLPGRHAAAVANGHPQRRAPGRAAQHARPATGRSPWRTRSSSSDCPASSGTTRDSSRAACRCAPRWPGRSSSSPRCSCSTSRSAHSTRSPGNASTTNCCGCSSSRGSPRCSSRTRSPRRSSCRRGWR